MMKQKHLNVCLVFSLFLMSFPFLLAQNADQKIHFSIGAGTTLSRVYTEYKAWDFSENKSRAAFSVEALFRFDFGKSFYAEFGVSGAFNKFRLHASTPDTAIGNLRIENSYTNISVPFNVGVRFFPKTDLFNIDFSVGGRLNLPQQTMETLCTLGRRTITTRCETANIGLQAGLNIQYAMCSIGIIYEHQLSPFIKVEERGFRLGVFHAYFRFRLF